MVVAAARPPERSIAMPPRRTATAVATITIVRMLWLMAASFVPGAFPRDARSEVRARGMPRAHGFWLIRTVLLGAGEAVDSEGENTLPITILPQGNAREDIVSGFSATHGMDRN
jgi:hypothetical protein